MFFEENLTNFHVEKQRKRNEFDVLKMVFIDEIIILKKATKQILFQQNKQKKLHNM